MHMLWVASRSCALVALFGWQRVLLIHLPIMVVASIAGVWLFSVQRRFETARWTAKGDWSFADAALQGSSWFGLLPILHWLTGNIGFHHVHHLNPRVPSYRLRAAHEGSAGPAADKTPQHSGRLARTVDDAVGRGLRPAGTLPRRRKGSGMTALPRYRVTISRRRLLWIQVQARLRHRPHRA